MDIETEYEEMGTEEEESEVKKLPEEELEMFQQYKEFYTIQGRAKRYLVSDIYIGSKLKNGIQEYHPM